MIERLEGTLVRSLGSSLYLQVGPATLEILVPVAQDGTEPAEGKPLALWTHLQWKEGEGPVLFGFRNPDERRLFRLLLQVQGVGPRIALAILAHLPPDRLLDRLLAKDDVVFTTVPGVGKKTAGRILVELGPQAEKLSLEIRGTTAGTATSRPQPSQDAVQALAALGYSPKEAEAALREVVAERSSVSVEEQIRLALRKLTQSPPKPRA
ncbi:MAG: Holliday junction branch migration protein RuvA [Candidatus Eisenbacteria bacterium]|nr:Holliday junction branch migration protein RuvA [Candidatus Eisenbacteria bacterium]